MIETLGNNLRYALRGLARNPLFTAVAILSLALGLGANTAIFGLLDQVLIRPLPGVQDQAKLVMLDSPGSNFGRIMGEYAFSYPMYRDIRDKNDAFSAVLARFPLSMNIGYNSQTEKADGEIVSGNYFELLGVHPTQGRLLTADDDVNRNAHPVVVLSHDYWRRRFGGDPGMVGRKIEVNGYPMTVLGVAPPEFRGVEVGRATDIWAPIAMKAVLTPTWDDLENRRSLWLTLLARLKPGVTRTQAEASLAVLYKPLLQLELSQMPADVPDRFRKRFAEKQLIPRDGASGIPGLRRDFSKPLIVLMAMVGVVLLIACANLANLLLARAAARRKEIAVRLALGARRSDLVWQLLTESVLLALMGAVAALVVASWASDLLVRALPQDGAARSLATGIDWRMMGFNFVLALVTGMLFGLAPAIQATRPDVAPTLKDQAGSVAGGSHLRSRKVLIVAQVALSLLLLIGAGLFARSLANLRQLDPGFQAQNLIQFMVDGTLSGYDQPRVRRVYEQLQTQLSAIPGVLGVAISESALISGDRSMSTVHVEGYERKEGDNMNPDVNGVSPGYFAAMRVPVVAGREFRPQDDLGAPQVAIVNESFARYFFGDRNPLGRRFGQGRDKGHPIEIVGVVKDSKYSTLRDQPVRMFYLPYRQSAGLSFVTVYIRTAQSPDQLLSKLRSEVASIDSGLALFSVKTMKTQVEESLFAERMVAQLCLFFGALATLLAAVGLYGVMAYSVARRTREIGIRMALGSGAGGILSMILREVGTLAGLGIVIGLPLAIALSQLIESQLYGLKPHDPLTLSAATGLLAAVAFLAGFLPAHRASRIDPLAALHYE